MINWRMNALIESARWSARAEAALAKSAGMLTTTFTFCFDFGLVFVLIMGRSIYAV
jgi:hypothetical protein